MKILLVEDEPEFANTIRSALQREKYLVDHVGHLALAKEATYMNTYDLVLLDRTLPDGDGLSLVSNLRAANPGLPIIMLTARGEVVDRVKGLDEGADDYLVKPFALDEMFARIRAIRRRPVSAFDEEIAIGSLIVDLANSEAAVAGTRVELSRRESSVLIALAKRRGRTVLRESLEQAVYGFNDAVQSNAIDSHISRLRKKLAEAGADIEIHAIKGVGYLLREQT